MKNRHTVLWSNEGCNGEMYLQKILDKRGYFALLNQILFSFDHRLRDSSPIAWILAFPVSNVRQAAVVESGQVNSMRCADSGALLSNVSLSIL